MNMKKLVLISLIYLTIFSSCGDSNEKAVENKESQNQKTITENKIINVGKGPDALFLTPDEKTLYVANVEDTFVSIINTGSEEVIGKIEGIKYPWGFTRLGNSNLVAVSGYDKQIVIIDFSENKIVKEKKFNNSLGGITSTKDGKYIFVIETDKNSALKLDANSLKIIDSYKTGNSPDGIGISKDDTKIYTSNTKDGTISVINTTTKKTEVLETGGKPELIHYDHNHSLLFISNFKLNKIHILDTGTDKIVHEIAGLNSPEEAVLSKSEKLLYVVNFGSKKINVYDAANYQKLNQEYSVGNKPIGVVSALNDTKLFVSNYGDNTVSVINLK
jgi:YVTN family beta-propeller protein